tara:strand:+ start:230 stop:1261 length:1032 start_codon:yes stop_codon:yes gene_type:complete
MNKLRSYYKIYFSVICLLTFSYGSSTVDEVTKVGTAAANWLKLETGTRAIGMGGAFTSIGSGIIGIPYNPSSVAFIKNQEGFLSKTSYLADISYHVMGYGRNLSGIDFVALHAFFLNSGPMNVTTEFYPDGTGETFSFNAMCIRAAFGKRITNRLRIGVAGKFIREEIYTTYMQSFALDIGSNFNTGIYGFVLGMSISNLGPEVQFEGDGFEYECDEEDAPSGFCKKIADSFILPLTFRLGLSNEIIGPKSDLIEAKHHKLLVSVDAINPIDYTLYGAIGMEYNYSDMFFLRGGTHFGHDTADWSLGGGLKLEINKYTFGLDYAYVNYGILNYTHQFGLNFEF